MKVAAVFVVLCLVTAEASAQISADPEILAEINRVKAVDNHTHVPKVVGPGERDDDFDALPCDPLEPNETPLMQRAENPKFVQAWQKLYGYKYNDRDPAHVRELLTAKQQVAQQQGDSFPGWVLDQLGLEYMLANRVAMGRGLSRPRFLWVPFDDALMAPLDNAAMADNPDRNFFYGREKNLTERYLVESGYHRLPATLEEYVRKVIVPTLERQKKAGAVAIKFEAAYLRSLDLVKQSCGRPRRSMPATPRAERPARKKIGRFRTTCFERLRWKRAERVWPSTFIPEQCAAGILICRDPIQECWIQS